MAHHHHQQENPVFLQDSLYCSEEHVHWEDVGEDNYHQELEQVDECFYKRNSAALVFLEQDLYWDDEELSRLLNKQEQNQLDAYLGTNPQLAAARKEAVEWMLKVNSRNSFSALTALLAVNYLDRFLSRFQFQNDKPWMTQLSAVACFSLAAKVEETQVPLLLELQVEDSSRYVFEAKTIKRMEILVLSTLGWKMNPVTPLSFLDYITRRLGLKDYLCWEFLKRCEAILLTLVADSRFVCYLPSGVATATMIHVVNSVEPGLGVEYQNQLLGILRINKDKVEECYKLILELVSGKESNKRKFGSVPGSPNGVMDVTFSSNTSDSSNDSWSVAGSVSSSPDPLSKKTRGQDQLLINHPNSDLLTIPR